MASLNNRVALVTGGSRGIGQAIAVSLAEAGAAIAVNYREMGDVRRAEAAFRRAIELDPLNEFAAGESRMFRQSSNPDGRRETDSP